MGTGLGRTGGAVMPVITISRQFGSYGDAVAELLCDRLGYRILDRGLMQRLAREAGLKIDKRIDQSEDRYRPWTLAERLLSGVGPPGRNPAIWAGYGSVVTREQAAAVMAARLIHAAYEMGQVIVVGRGGQEVLHGKPNVLHVRLVAPLAVRVRRHQVRAGLTVEAAHKEVVDRDQGSADFIKRYYDVDIGDPSLYDLIVNTGRLSLEDVAGLIADALAGLPQASSD